jgi:hypothetical protein
MGALDGLINKITGGVGGALGNVFGGSIPGVGGGSGGPSVPGIPGVGSGAGGVAGAGGAVAGAGATAVIGAVTGVISAVSDVIGNFQMMAMNKSLDILVKHTLQMVNILGGDSQDSGISLKLKMIEDGIWYGPLVKATEDFRNKWFDFGLPVFRALEAQGAFVQPTLNDISMHGVWQLERLDAIAGNTERTAIAVEQLRGVQASQGLQVEQLQTAVERNEGGITTTLSRFVRSR